MAMGLATGGFPLGLSELGAGYVPPTRTVTFDPATFRIILSTVTITATEIYSAWVDWAAVSDNAKYGAVFRQVGSDDLGGGLSIPPYFFLQGAWRVRPMESNHNLTITGNLFVEGGGVPVVSTLGVYQVNVNYTVPVQAQGISTAGSSAPTAAEIALAVRDEIMGASIDGEITLPQILRLLASIHAGNIVRTGNSYSIHAVNAAPRERLSGTIDANGNRTITNLDVLP